MLQQLELLEVVEGLRGESGTMLYLVGLGLGDPKDVTLKGFEIIKNASKVYLESYTSILCGSKEQLSAFYEREIIVADRELVEQGADEILETAKEENVVLLVIGDPLGATTHTDIILRAKNLGIKFKVVHNASIMNAVGVCGLQLYNYGETVSIPFWTDSWQPDSFCHKIIENKKRGLHTLCLLDIKVKEPNLDQMIKGKVVYDPPRFMTVAQAAKQLLEIVKKLDNPLFQPKDKCVGLARVGTDTQEIIYSSLEEMSQIDLGPPLHSLVICGDLHPLELEYVTMYGTEKKK